MYPKKPENQLPRTRGRQEGPYRLLPWVELVEEALGRYNRALRDKGSTIGVVGMRLEQTVPML
jgi:hypothetical protein